MQSNAWPALQIPNARGSQIGCTLVEVMLVVMLVAFVTFGILAFFASPPDQRQLTDSGNEGTETIHQSTSIDKPAPRHSASGPISNLESF